MAREGPNQAGLEVLTRRQLLHAAGAMALGASALAPGRAVAHSAALGRAQRLRSEPVEPPLLSVAMGNLQTLADGHVLLIGA